MIGLILSRMFSPNALLMRRRCRIAEFSRLIAEIIGWEGGLIISFNFFVSPVPLLAQLNPSGAERLPPGIVASKSDLYLRRLWGLPSEDLKTKPKYLVTFTVGLDMKENIDKAVKKTTSLFCSSITMVRRLSGISLSGQNMLSMSVLENRRNGGMQNDFYILTLWHHMITYLSGTKIWEWIILIPKNDKEKT
ncbi:uncharacterized protein LOC110685468 isoform X3 [Chenopodium quinoa]|uniref:uncharacterized protein LOC110685468 isoform X3 n=1 Tax=Chenopodium quinoa TaxID=63459 RepID=UPI000B78244A|nr:uncharacterized protein LOC110685468 isoform X3 [Chenopodium quinoa]